MLSITNHQGNASKITIRYHLTHVIMSSIKRQLKKCWQEHGERKFLCTVGGNVNFYSHYGKKSIECLKKPKLGIQYDPAIPLLGIHQNKQTNLKH